MAVGEVGMILVVDDDEALRGTIVRGLELRGETVEAAANEAEARSALRERRFDAVILDLAFDGDWRIVLSEALRSRSPSPAVIILSGGGNIALSVEAMKLGASDFLEKPIGLDALTERLRRHRPGRAPLAVAVDEAPLRLDHALERLERAHIERVLLAAAGSRSRAAQLLCISRSTLYEKIKRHGLE